jgi:hypothetical protein
MFDSTDYDYLYLHNSGKENVPIYAGDENAVSPSSNKIGVVIRFKASIATHLLGYLAPRQCVKIKMTQDSKGFMESITVAELYKAYTEKNPRNVFRQIAPR